MKKILFIALISTIVGFAQNDKVKFTAKIENRNSDTIHIKGANLNHAIAVNKEGVFTDSFEAPKGGYQLFDGTEYAKLYLMPGYDLNMTMDAKHFDQTIKFDGKGANENNFLAMYTLDSYLSEDAMASPDEAVFAKYMTQSHAKFDKALTDPMLDQTFKSMMEGAIKQQFTQMPMMYKQAQVTSGLVGKRSPNFEFENHKGGKTKLADLKGKYVYIDTWATWCGPCRAEIPSLKKVEEAMKGKKVAFVSISIDEKKDYEKWRNFVKEKDLGGVQLIADNAWQSEFATAYGINSIPRFILLDPKGNVVDANAKRPSDPELQKQLQILTKK